MGINCSSNDSENNGNSGFNPGHNNGQDGFNPGGESHRPHSRQAGNMAPNPEQPQNPEAADKPPAEAAAVPHGSLASPTMPPQQPPVQPPQGNASQAPAGLPAQDAAGQTWIDQRTNQPLEYGGYNGSNIPLNDADANRAAWERLVGRPSQGNGPEANEQGPPLDGRPAGNSFIIGAVSADAGGQIVQEGHWEEFDAANNVMTLEEYHASLQQ